MADSVFTIIGRTTRNYVDTAVAAIDLSSLASLDGANFTGEIALRDGSPIGVLENFYAGLLVPQAQVTIDRFEFDAVASGNSVTINGDTSPFSATITLSYSNPSEVTYTLSENTTAGTNTICDLRVDLCSKEAYENLANGGNITIGSSLVGFV